MGEEGGAGKGLSRDHISVSAHGASSFKVSREKERVTESPRVATASVSPQKTLAMDTKYIFATFYATS